MTVTYLDWAATAPPDRAALEYGNKAALKLYGNPSSLHGPGKEAARFLDACRRRLAELLGCEPEQLYFTSGGSESNSIVFSQLLTHPGTPGITVSAIEHPSVWETARFYESLGYGFSVVEPGRDGRIAPTAAAAATGRGTGLVSIMLVNNETGTIQDISAIAAAVRDAAEGRRPHLHCDAVQALGKMPLNLERLGVDSASFSGHKIGAPRGVGLLYLRRPVNAMLRGGGQEGGIRPGTENLAGAAALTKALETRLGSLERDLTTARRLKERLVSGLSRLPRIRFLPQDADPLSGTQSPWILSCSLPPFPGEVLQRVFSDAGFAVSTGSACASNHKKSHRVLRAMGVDPDTAESSIRVSLGPATEEEAIDAFIEAAAVETSRLRGEKSA